MGQCCSGGEAESSPLLNAAGSGQYRSREVHTNEERHVPVASVSSVPQSARQNTASATEEFEGFKAVGIERVDRQMRDSLDIFFSLKQKYNDMTAMLSDLIGSDNADDAKIDELFSNTAARIDSEGIQIKLDRKKKYYLHIMWDETRTPTELTAFFRKFNEINRYCQQIIDKADPLKSSVQLLIGQEDEMKRDLMAHLSSGKNNPNAWRSFNKNMSQLRKIPGTVENMVKRTKEIAEQIIRSSVVFTKE